MRVAAVQPDTVWEDRGANLDRLAGRLAQAAGTGADLIVLPEMFATGFSMNTAATSEAADGPTTRWLLEQASACDAWVGGSLAQAAPGGRPHNMFVLAGPDGTLHRYAKIHTFTHAGEHEHFAAGDDLVTVEVEGVRITPFVCYDLRFADEFWTTGPGTDLFVVPANWPASRHDHWVTLARARAIENQCYLLGVNRVGTDGHGLGYAGGSCLIDPLGRTVVEAGDAEDIVSGDVDPDTVAEVRLRFAALADRRTGREPPGQPAQSST